MSRNKTQKDNSTKLGKQYMNKMRSLTKRQKSLNTNKAEILDVRNARNEMKKKKWNREHQEQNGSSRRKNI